MSGLSKRDDTLGWTAYNAYRRASHYRSLVSGDPLPEWSELPEQIQQAWASAAEAVRQIYPPVQVPGFR